MCGRFGMDEHRDSILNAFDWLSLSTQSGGVSELSLNANVRPTQESWVIGARASGRPSLRTMRWGMITAGHSRPHINARIETLRQRATFRNAFAKGRCLVPVSGYYEWYDAGEGKAAHYATNTNGPLLLLAGLYARDPSGELGFAVVTRPSEGAIAEHHPRMPLIVSGEEQQIWLKGTDPRQRLMQRTPQLEWRAKDPAPRPRPKNDPQLKLLV